MAGRPRKCSSISAAVSCVGRAVARQYCRGRNLGVHALRATSINLVIESNVNPKEAQTLARHATAELTIGLYGRAADQRLVQAIDQIAQHVICMVSAGEGQTQVIEIYEEKGMPKG